MTVRGMIVPLVSEQAKGGHAGVRFFSRHGGGREPPAKRSESASPAPVRLDRGQGFFADDRRGVEREDAYGHHRAASSCR